MTAGEDVMAAVRAFFAAPPPGVVAAYVFGGVARGRMTDSSDVDVAVLLEGRPSRTLEGLRPDLRDDLQEHVGRPVDLVILNHAPADLVHRVLRDGVLVAETDPAARVAFEVRRRNEYFDLEPVRLRYRRAALMGAPPS